ncbi:pyruvate kinase 2, cytosolic-like [Cucumis melo var. makuwa]|uniref:Pyruvate kinase 2, cytosolic-like n=1 Tax=Cucumis melo var. makuwa TaxID=1194695 RepID=A0A5D3BXT4_CUCMM|nr:pyruvate kinase 2, cytosolic-like [Cucumis melo var. makuwa]TYK03652.1 pyruvate kinase 2, cytosolic-like [Cucumis melo var. makuwa]
MDMNKGKEEVNQSSFYPILRMKDRMAKGGLVSVLALNWSFARGSLFGSRSSLTVFGERLVCLVLALTQLGMDLPLLVTFLLLKFLSFGSLLSKLSLSHNSNFSLTFLALLSFSPLSYGLFEKVDDFLRTFSVLSLSRLNIDSITSFFLRSRGLLREARCLRKETLFLGQYLFTGSETSVWLEVVEVKGDDVGCLVKNSTTLVGTMYTLHVVEIHIDLPTLTEKDKE